MEVTVLCIRLLVDVFVLLAAQVDHSYSAQKADAVFLRVDPSRLQFSEYESFSVTCEGTDGVSDWRVMRKLQKASETNSSDAYISLEPSCTFEPAFKRDSGEYWCEDEDGGTSDAVNISVVAGSVVLDIPAQPVMEGNDVILHCFSAKTESKQRADFYKDGVLLVTHLHRDMILRKVSKSDAGRYKCVIFGMGESPESQLAVVNQVIFPEPSDHHSPEILVFLLTVVTVLSVDLLLLVTSVKLCSIYRERQMSKGGNKPGLQEDAAIYSSVIYRPLTPD